MNGLILWPEPRLPTSWNGFSGWPDSSGTVPLTPRPPYAMPTRRASRCLAFAENLGRLLGQDAGTLRPRQLEQLAVQSTARGNDNPLRVAEVGALPCISHPGAVTGIHSVVVWGPLDSPAMPSPWPWSKSELASLRAAGCTLPDTDSLLQQVASDWLRPILAAKDRLILLLPPVDRESHPVWQMLDALLPKIPVQPVEAMLLNGTESLEAVEHSPLPGIKRWWQLPLGTHLPAVAEYSYSQLEKQIFNPYHWLLRMRPSYAPDPCFPWRMIFG